MTPDVLTAELRQRRDRLMRFLRSPAADVPVAFALYLVVLFPVVDYLLRRIPLVRFGAPLWDQALLFFLIVVTLARREKGEAKFLPALVPLLAFSATSLVVDLNYPGAALEGLRVTLQFIPLFFAARHLVDSTKTRVWLFRAVGISAALIAFLGLIQPLVGVETPAGWVDMSETIGIRIFSIVQSPNVLGGHMALAAAIMLGLAWYENGRREKIAWSAGAAVTGITLLLTFSRGAWLAFAGAILLITLILDRRVFVVLLIITLLAGVGVPQVRTRLFSVFSPEYIQKSALDGRLGRWLRAYDQLRKRPLFGMGPGRYGGAVAARRFGISYVDNYYVKTAVEMGLLGLIAFLYWIWAPVRAAYARWRRLRGRRLWRLYAGVICALAAVLLHNGVENIFEVPYMNAYFWFILGLLLPARDEEAGDLR
ncbi:MAG: O-antigen ligase family protein [Bacillota bacterium]